MMTDPSLAKFTTDTDKNPLRHGQYSLVDHIDNRRSFNTRQNEPICNRPLDMPISSSLFFKLNSRTLALIALALFCLNIVCFF